MAPRQRQVRVRLGSGEIIEALVLEWLSYPDRALVQLPARKRPSSVARHAATGLYRPPWRPRLTLRLALSLVGVVSAGVVLGLLLPPAAAPEPAALTSRAAARQASRSEAPQVRSRPAPVPAPRSSSAYEPPQAPQPLPRPPRRPAPPLLHQAGSTTAEPPRPARVEPWQPSAEAWAPRYAPTLTAMRAPSGPASRDAYTCECGQTFQSAAELKAHQRATVYACIRYPGCTTSATTTEAIVQHYEKDRDGGAHCWLEAARFGSRYAVVVRPKCKAAAANPDRRRVIKVLSPLRLNEDESRPRR